MIASPTGTSSWDVEHCLIRELDEIEETPPVDHTVQKAPIIFDGAPDSNRQLRENALILAWFMGENILVWEDGLDCLWDSESETWGNDDNCKRYGPTPPGPKYKRNRGPVWVLLRSQRRVCEKSRVFLSSY